MFRKRNPLGRLLLKLTDPPGYKTYKWELKNDAQRQVNNRFLSAAPLNTIEKIKALAVRNGHINISHSGNAGDVIYALPTIRRIRELTKAPVNFYLRLGTPLVMNGFDSHPMGNVMLNETMAGKLIPLLSAQGYIDSCGVLTSQQIDIDLDSFRLGAIPLSHGNIARWCGYVTGVSPELWKSWLQIVPDKSFSGTIIIARSERYRNPFIDYSFLSDYPDIIFVGVESEYLDMKASIPPLQWRQVKDFSELAAIIAGCRLFIGNQSFPFSLAEGLKIPRILEAYYEVANVIPEGEGANEFFFQEHFESLVADISAGHPG